MKIFEVSIIKTLFFNIHYFGLSGLKLPVVVSRKMKLQNCGGSVEISNPVFAGVHLGFSGVSIFDYKYQRSIWENKGKVKFISKATLGLGTRISNYGVIKFGNEFRVTANSYFICYKCIEFGDDCLISWDCAFMDTDLHKVQDQYGNIINGDKTIKFGNKVWVGTGSTILKGSSITNNVVIAAGSKITGQDCNIENSVVTSFGKIIKSDIRWNP